MLKLGHFMKALIIRPSIAVARHSWARFHYVTLTVNGLCLGWGSTVPYVTLVEEKTDIGFQLPSVSSYR